MQPRVDSEITLSQETVDRFATALGGKPDIIKMNGYAYQVQPDGTAKAVVGADGQPLREADKADTSPTTIHVKDKGWMEYTPGRGWSLIPGSEERPSVDASRPETYNVPGRGVVAVQRPTPGAAGPIGSSVIPGTEPVRDPTSTQENIDAKDQAAADADKARTNLVNKQADAVETPAQQLAREKAVIRERVMAEYDAKEKELDAKLKAGLILPEKAKLEMETFQKKVLADHDSALRTAEKEFEFKLAQPNRDRELKVSEENAATNKSQAEANRVYQQQQVEATRRGEEVGTLKDQSKQTQSFIDQGIKLGVAPTMGLVRGALDPLMMALQLSREAVQGGAVPSTAMPRPSAPQPAAGPATGRTAPAPAVPATTAPAPTNLPPLAPNEQRNFGVR